MPDKVSTMLQGWLTAYAQTARQADRVEVFVAFVDARISGGIAEISRDRALMEDLHQSTRSQWVAFLDGMSAGGYTFTLTPQAIGLAQSLARRGMDLTVLLKVYRLAAASLWEFFTGVVAGLGPDDPPRDEVLVYLYGLAVEWVEEMTERLVEVFYADRGQFFDGAAARRRELVDAILAGDPVDAGAADLALRHPIQRTQLCIVFWAREATPQTLPSLHEVARAVARQIGAPEPLTVIAGSREVWCWFALADGEHPAPLDVSIPVSITAAVGSPIRGIEGFRVSHEEARAVQALVETASGEHAVTRYEDVALLCLAGGRTEAGDRMVRGCLGELAGGEPGRRVLRDTVGAFIQHGMSVDATAAALLVHRNTVRYRLGRAEAFLPVPIADQHVRLAFALQYAAWFDVTAP